MSWLTVGSMFIPTGYAYTLPGILLCMEHSHGKGVLDELAPLGRELRHAIPDVYKGFADLHKAALAPGALDTAVKELMALAIGVSHRCDGCIASHARGAVRAGATKEQAAEAIGVAFLMDGGPATVYGPRAYAAFCEFWEAAHSEDAPAA